MKSIIAIAFLFNCAFAFSFKDMNIIISHQYEFYGEGTSDSAYDHTHMVSLMPTYNLYESKVQMGLNIGFNLNGIFNTPEEWTIGGFYRDELNVFSTKRVTYHNKLLSIGPTLLFQLNKLDIIFGSKLDFDFIREERSTNEETYLYNSSTDSWVYDNSYSYNFTITAFDLSQNMILGLSYNIFNFDLGILFQGLEDAEFRTYMAWSLK